MDSIYHHTISKKIHRPFKGSVNNGSTGGKYIISYFDLESIREYKLLSLGIGERIDYENFMLYKMRNENDENFRVNIKEVINR
jgi:hypothetical protein